MLKAADPKFKVVFVDGNGSNMSLTVNHAESSVSATEAETAAKAIATVVDTNYTLIGITYIAETPYWTA